VSTRAQKARWWAADYAYAVVGQIGGELRGGLLGRRGRRRIEQYRTGTGRPVVVLPGIWERWTFLEPLVERLHAAGHPVHVITAMRLNDRPVAETAEAVMAYLVEHDLTDTAIVAHSKGGLVGKFAMAYLDDGSRIARMIAVSTPFSGSRYAPFLLLRSLRAFSPNDPTTRRLASSLEANTRIVSVAAEFDPHIPEGSGLAGARNVVIPTGGHFRILGDRRVVDLVLEVVAG
jgi:triacylglycerol lipase